MVFFDPIGNRFRFFIYVIAVALVNPSISNERSSLGGRKSLKISALRCEYSEQPLAMDSQAPRFTWTIPTGGCQKAFTFFLSKDSSALISNADWKSERIVSKTPSYTYSGPVLEPLTRYYWGIVAESCEGTEIGVATSFFDTGIQVEDNWAGSWISDAEDTGYRPASMFQKDFRVDKVVHSAKCYIASAGIHSLSLNGSTATGSEFLNPVFTDFSKRIFYCTYDITRMIEGGENALEVLLGNGWYNHQPVTSWDFSKALWRGRPKFILNLVIDYSDGSREIVSTNSSWKVRDSPYQANSIYVGETYDQQYTRPPYIYKPVRLVKKPPVQIQSQAMPPVIKESIGNPMMFLRKNPTDYFMGFKKNIAGIVEIAVPAVSRRTTLELTHGEVNLGNQVNNSHMTQHYFSQKETGKFQTDVVTIDRGRLKYTPLFSYKGFQYLQINSDLPIELKEEDVEAFFIHSDLKPIGRFESSNELLNSIWEATNNSYLSNMAGYPTDCPQREKNGWTGDGHIALEIGLFNYDVITTYEKWMLDHRDAQQASGLLPMIIPTSGWGYENATFGWTCSAILVPWNVYLFTGDDLIIKDNYAMMKRFMDYWEAKTKNHLMPGGLGDWKAYNAKSSTTLIESVLYYQCASYMAKMANVVRNQKDVLKYHHLAKKIRKAINRRFYKVEGGYYASGYQTEQSLPLEAGIVPTEEVPRVVRNLVAQIEENEASIDAGIVGVKSIPMVLSKYGYGGLSYQFATKTQKPSLGYWVANGATTLREGWGLSGGSSNHVYFGTLVSWFYRILGGVNPVEDQPGFENVLYTPFIPDGLDFVNVSYNSVRGTVSSAWKTNKTGIEHQIAIPGGSTAEYRIPEGYFYSGMHVLSSSDQYRPYYNHSDHSLTFKSGEYTILLTDSIRYKETINILFNGSDSSWYEYDTEQARHGVNFRLSLEGLPNSGVVYELVNQNESAPFYLKNNRLLSNERLDKPGEYQLVIRATFGHQSIEEYFTLSMNLQKEARVILFPNPAENEVRLQFPGEIPKDEDTLIEYFILGLDGKQHVNGALLSRDKELAINVSRLSGGIYLLRVYRSNKVYNLRFRKGI